MRRLLPEARRAYKGSGRGGRREGGVTRRTCSGEGGERGELTMVTSSLASESDFSDIERVVVQRRFASLLQSIWRTTPLDTRKTSSSELTGKRPLIRTSFSVIIKYVQKV
jgi:hypothetical protein